MALTQPDLAVPIRNAIIANGNITDALATYDGAEAVFTRRPVPADAIYPVAVVSPDLSRVDGGFVAAEHLMVQRDVAVYGRNDTVAKYRTVETLGYNLFDLFHRKPKAIVVPGWTVINIWATGPHPAPDDDDMMVGRMVTLKIELIAAM